MSYNVSIDIDIGSIQQEIMAGVLPIVAQAIASTAEYGANEWRNAVMKAKLLPYDKQAYVDSISWKMTGGLSAEIVADYDASIEIDKGRPARDMKKVLQTSQRTRVAQSGSHAGQRYLIIPFRHNTPGFTAHANAMPAHIYKQAKPLSKSFITGSTTRISGSGDTVHQAIYKWGSRLPAGLAPKLKDHHKTDIYAGMVRMNTSAGKGKSSSYMTFRVMGEWSTGWIYPAQPGLFFARDIGERIQPILEASIGKALQLS